MSGWILVILAAFAMVAGVVALIRGSIEAATTQMIFVVLVLALAAAWALDHIYRDRGGERLEALALELSARTLVPGSPLACLDGMAGETVEEACEKALFASAETTAAAVSYVAAQLALLAAAGDAGGDAQKSTGLLHTSLRRAIETDRFGIVAHVLAARGRCTPNQCSAFALLQDATRVKTNLARRPFEARVAKHMVAWSAPGQPAAATEPLSAELTGAPAGRAASRDLYFPSADSIPPVNIMTAEPAARQPGDTTGEASAPSPRKPAPPAASSTAPPSRQPPAPARSEPMQLAPGAQ